MLSDEAGGLKVCGLKLGMSTMEVIRAVGNPQVSTEVLWRYVSNNRSNPKSTSPEEVVFEMGYTKQVARGRLVSLNGREILNGMSSRTLVETELGAPDGYCPDTFQAVYLRWNLKVQFKAGEVWYSLAEVCGPLLDEKSASSARVQRRPKLAVNLAKAWIQGASQALSGSARNDIDESCLEISRLCDNDAPAQELSAATRRLEDVFTQVTGQSLWARL